MGPRLAQHDLLAVEQVGAHGALNAFISTKMSESVTPWHLKQSDNSKVSALCQCCANELRLRYCMGSNRIC